jgi:predicted outer membrane repeat protein
MQKYSKVSKVLMIILFLITLTFQAVQVKAQGFHAVDRGTIQDMINAAPDGGTVNLPGGTFSETLTINKNLTLNGYGFYDTILQPAGAGQRVITVGAGKNLAINNLQIQNGQQPGGNGGGIYMTDGNLTIDRGMFLNNSAAYGGAIFQETATKSLSIGNSYFFDNTASIDGGAIYSKGNSSVSAYFGGNIAGRNGGGIHANSGTLLISWGKFEHNTASTGNGGGINVNDSVSITGTYFDSNTSGDLGGGISQWNTGKTVSFEAVTFDTNTAKNSGGGVFLKSHATISYTKFISNTVNAGTGTTAYGGGLYADGGADITYGMFINNQALCNTCSLALGGGIYTGGGVLNVTNALFARNAARIGSAIDFTSTTG